jgi:uncharacterized protein (DUF488 family)
MSTRLYTIGHSRHSAEQFIELLARWDIRELVDVRRIPFSRRNPQFSRDRLAGTLREHQVAYRHLEDLGGLRDPAAALHSRNIAWRNPFFRSYADYAQTKPFREALGLLMLAAAQSTCTIMCAEGDWRQCHRQIISDYLLLRDIEVLHIRPDGAIEPAHLTPSATVVADGTLLYSNISGRQLPLGLA